MRINLAVVPVAVIVVGCAPSYPIDTPGYATPFNPVLDPAIGSKFPQPQASGLVVAVSECSACTVNEWIHAVTPVKDQFPITVLEPTGTKTASSKFKTRFVPKSLFESLNATFSPRLYFIGNEQKILAIQTQGEPIAKFLSRCKSL